MATLEFRQFLLCKEPHDMGNLDPYIAAGRYAVTIVGSIAATLGVVSVSGVSVTDIQGAFNHIFSGAKEIAIGLGTLFPIVASVYGTLAARLSTKVSDVHAAAPDQLAHAVAQVAPSTLAKATASIPGVQVSVAADASDPLRALAADTSQPNIVAAVPDRRP
jgi:hypothetical protein